MHARNYLQTIHSVLLQTHFLPQQLSLEGQWKVANLEISYQSMYQNVANGKFMFLDRKLSKSSDFYYLEPGHYPSIKHLDEAMNNHIQGRHNHSESCITVERSRRTQNVEVYLVKGGSGLALFSTDLGNIFGGIVGNEFGVMSRGKGPHKPKSAYDTVRIHCYMIYTDLIEYNIVGDTKTNCCFVFFSFQSSKPETSSVLDHI